MNYKAIFPLTTDMSSIWYVVGDNVMKSKEEEALWWYNRSRDKDGLPPLNNLPTGVKFEAIYS